MSVTDWVQSATSILAVVIATGTLWWSVKIQHDTSRPYVVAFLKPISMHGVIIVYLVIKNFGKTGAKVMNFHASVPLVMKSGNDYTNNPFEKVTNTLIAPQQSISAGLTADSSAEMEVKADEALFSFDWQEDGSSKWNHSEFPLDIKAAKNTDTLFASPNSQSRDEIAAIDSLSRIVAESSGESTVNKL